VPESYRKVADPLNPGKILCEIDVERGLLRVIRRGKPRTIDLVADYGLKLAEPSTPPKVKGENQQG